MFSFGKVFSDDVFMGDASFTETFIETKPNEGLRSTELATSAKIEQKQDSGKTVLVIDSRTPLSKSTVEKISKVISSTKQKPVEEASKQEQIEEFLKKYKSFNDVPVKDMRHIIPLLLMEVYVEKYGLYTKKVKGLWEKRPEDWPENVPFVDPNNRLKNEGEKNVKPKKELLGQMLSYLVERYTKMKSAAETSDRYLQHADDPLLCFPNQYDDLCRFELNLVESNDNELRAAEQSVSDQSLNTQHSSGYSLQGFSNVIFRRNVKSSLSSVTNDGSLIQSSLSTLEDPLSGGVDEEHGELVEDGPISGLELHWAKQIHADLDARPPEQVVDNEEETSSMKDWNPLEEICERTRHKLGYMRTQELVPKAMQDQLESVHGLLKNLLVSLLDDDAKLELLDKWHQLEKCIDTAKFHQPIKCSKMVQDLHDELNPKMIPSIGFMDNNTVESKSMDLTIFAEDPQQLNSLLNIRPRPGPAIGMVPFQHGNQLEMRCLPSGSNNDCGVSTLSDNCKPIQLAQEDGEAQKSVKAEDDLVTMDGMLPSWNVDDLTEWLSQLIPQEELSVPIQESAPGNESTPQLAGKLEMEIAAEPLHHMVTSVSSVQPCFGECPTIFTFSSPSVASSQLTSTPSVSQPYTAFAEEWLKRLSLSVNPSPSPVQRADPNPPMQPLLDQLLSKQRPSGRPGGKRCYPVDEEVDKVVSGPSKPAKAPTYNTVIPLVVEEISNNVDKPFPRLLKRKTSR